MKYVTIDEVPEEVRKQVIAAVCDGYDEGGIEALLIHYPEMKRDEAVNLYDRFCVDYAYNVAKEKCDMECGNRFFNGAKTCRHGRDVNASMQSVL